MASQTALFSQHFSLDRSLPGCWKLAANRAITMRPREDGVLRIAHGRVWVTLEGPHAGFGNESGDHVLAVGQEITLRAGQHAVLEAWGEANAAPAYFAWDPVPARVPHPVRELGHWQLAVAQPLADLRAAFGLALGASGRLVSGIGGFALDLVAGRARGARAAAAFNAQSRACSAHGAMS